MKSLFNFSEQRENNSTYLQYSKKAQQKISCDLVRPLILAFIFTVKISPIFYHSIKVDLAAPSIQQLGFKSQAHHLHFLKIQLIYLTVKKQKQQKYLTYVSNFCFFLCTLSTDAILGNFMSSWFTRCLRNATFFKIMVPENARLLGKGKYH